MKRLANKRSFTLYTFRYTRACMCVHGAGVCNSPLRARIAAYKARKRLCHIFYHARLVVPLWGIYGTILPV